MVKVELAVYDLSNGMAAQLSEAILGQKIDGIWHTGVVVFGREYFFGGGIQNVASGAFTTMNGLRPCQMLHLGDTDKSQSQLEEYLRSIDHEYTQATYDLINHNCNNFSDTVANFLLGRGIPEHIVDLPRIVFSTPGGMMLRPMVESMQNGISQQGGGMDPFGGGSGANNPMSALSSINNPATYANNTSTTTTEVTSGQNAKVITTSSRVFSPTHEEKAFVSADIDSQMLRTLCNKILNFQDSRSENEKEGTLNVLGPEEKANLQSTIDGLIDGSLKTFPHDTFALLGRLVQDYPHLQMASLFVLRLLSLRIYQRDIEKCGYESDAYKACQEASFGLLRLVKAGEENDHVSPSVIVMTICTLANIVSSPSGCDLLFRPVFSENMEKSKADAEDRLNTCVDICAWGLSHKKAEVRQMSATLAYNLALASTRGKDRKTLIITQDITSLPWRSLHDSDTDKFEEASSEEEEEGDLHQHIVQILCAVLETVSDETDTVSLGRKLHAAYYVCVAGGSQARELVTTLGFGDNLKSVRDKLHVLSEADKLRLGNFELLLHGPEV